MTNRPIETHADSASPEHADIEAGISGDAHEGDNRHSDKYNDPRAKITRRGLMIGGAVSLFGVVGAAASIYARRTQLTRTTEFWGQDTIMALQLAERMELRPRGGGSFDPVDLTSTPGLGLLRRALLDQRSFDWETETPAGIIELCESEGPETPTCVQLRLTDPTGHRFEPIEIDIDLRGGWVGPGDGSKRVQATEWVQPKLRNYLGTIIHVRQKRYDYRE